LAAQALAEAPAPTPAPSPATVPSPLTAQSAAPKVTGEVQLSYLKSNGSSSLETLKGLLASKYARDVWTHDFRFEVLNETDSISGRHTRERYLVIEKTSWNFTPRDYLFVRPQFEKDQQSLYDYQTMLTTGYGHQFFKTEKVLLSIDAGVGVRHSKARISRDHDEDTVANSVLNFEWRFRPGSRLVENASVEGGEENTIARSRTALNFSLTGVLGLVISFDIKHDDSSATADDSLLTVGLSYVLK
jgi:putative salt-induced outer membrane protein YdiY